MTEPSLAALALGLAPAGGNANAQVVADARPDRHTQVATPGAAMLELRFGSVTPEGWLKQLLEKQRDGLTGHLRTIFWPFTGDMWSKDQTTGTKWGSWEQMAYWCDGAIRLGVELRDQSLLDQALPLIRFTLSHPARDGYLGPTFLSKPADFHRWPHTVFFRGVMAWQEASGERSLLDTLLRFYTGSGHAYTAQREQTHIEIMLWLFARTGDRRMLAMAEETWAAYQRKRFVSPEEDALSERAMLTPGPVNCHGVTYAEHSKLPAILYLYTGKQHYRDLAVSAQRKVFAHHMLVDGIPSTTEWMGETTGRDGHETCNVTDYSWNWGYMLMATGDGAYADQIERATFNAGMGSLKSDWRALQYYSSPNQFLCTALSDHLAITREVPEKDIREVKYMQRMSYRPSPGWVIACCPGNVNRFLPNYVGRMWMRDARDGGLTAALYGPCRVRATAGRGEKIEISEETGYPFAEKIHFGISCAAPVEFSLRLRIPAWCTAAKVFVNGQETTVAAPAGSFALLRRRFVPGDRVTLQLPMEIASTEWPQNGLAVERGPLVYSIPIKGAWSTVADNLATTEFPAWDLANAGPWNYALVQTGKQQATKPMVTAIEQAGGPDPWVEPPVALKAVVRRVKGWGLTHVERPEGDCVFTPRLPDPAVLPGLLENEREEVILVPYGSTHLRLTVFPRLKPEEP